MATTADGCASSTAISGTPRDPAPAEPAVRRYDPDAAVAYARKHWGRVCSDGFIAMAPAPPGGYHKLDAGTVFVHDVDPVTGKHSEHALSPDGKRIAWEPLDDCSHFVSCCIGDEPTEQGGGLHVPGLERLGAPGHVPYGLVGATRLGGWLRGQATGVIEIPLGDRTLIEGAAPGDVIGCRNGPGDDAYAHFMLYLGAGKIACHTYARCDRGGVGWTDGWDNDWNVGERGGWATGWTVFKLA